MSHKTGLIAMALAVSAPLILPATAHATNVGQAPGVDYTHTAKCAYSDVSNGWASVGGAPRGTYAVNYTMRTGTPGAWDAETIVAYSRNRKWRIVTDPGMSFINWVTFVDASGQVLASQMVNERCAGTPEDWPR